MDYASAGQKRNEKSWDLRTRITERRKKARKTGLSISAFTWETIEQSIAVMVRMAFMSTVWNGMGWAIETRLVAIRNKKLSTRDG